MFTETVIGTACFLLGYSAQHLDHQLRERRQRRNQAQYGYDRTPKPLPMRTVETGQRFKVAGGKWPLLIGHENEWTVWVILNLDELPRPPAAQVMQEFHADQSTPAQGGAA